MDERWPRDVPFPDVLSAFERLGFVVVRTGSHLHLSRIDEDGRVWPLTLPNHRRLKGSTLRVACRQAGIDRRAFLEALRGN